MSRRVLVTGISSFTGPFLAQALNEAGYDVYGLTQDGPPCAEVTLIEGNLLDLQSLNGAVQQAKPDFVIHLAAITFVPHGDISEMYLTNVVGTRNLLEALATNAGSMEQVILASSANVYGNSTEGSLGEDTPFSPANDYAASKVAMEYMAAIWSDRLPISFVRPFNYTGVGQSDKFLIPKIVSHFKRKEAVIELGNTEVVRDFSDVRFVAQAYIQLLEGAVVGQSYNICSGAGHSLQGVIATMCDLAGYTIDVRVNPDFVRENEVRRLVGDNSKLLALSSDLAPIEIRETLEWMYLN